MEIPRTHCSRFLLRNPSFVSQTPPVRMTQAWLGRVVITYHRKYDCGEQSSALAQWSRLLNTLDRGNLRQLKTKNVWPTEPQISITDWNVESRACANLENSMNHFKVSIKPPRVYINYSCGLRIITLFSLYKCITYNIWFITSMCVREMRFLIYH